MKDASLHNPNWLRFTTAVETKSALAAGQWRRYRRGLRRLEGHYRGLVPVKAMQAALAADAFFCAAHWKLSARIVRHALRALVAQKPGAKVVCFASAEYFQWALRVSQIDLAAARQMVDRARADTSGLDALTRANVERMFVAVVDSRPRPGARP